MNSETLGGYERGDTSPDLDFLAMYKQRFSVNLNWLIAGEGEMFAGMHAAGQPTGYEDELARIEAGLNAFDTFPINPAAMPPEAEALYQALQKIVTETDDDRARARADLHLRLAFGDAAAAERQKFRQNSFIKRWEAANARLQTALHKVEWEPPLGLTETLKALSFGYGLSEQDLGDLLRSIRSACRDA
ncbi:Peptidase, S24 family [Polymorphum gilvum SL003B-26A1]|uniref:Peptidase, S24 family n=2 Tax=Polymorphum TaxID=991903 RepID=F2J541_POLGS|nr:Peptidase, S24 family [Polymorphum gilvum SL003B-26A1]